MLDSVPSTSPLLSPVFHPQTLWRNWVWAVMCPRLHTPNHCHDCILFLLGLQLKSCLFPGKQTVISPFSEFLNTSCLWHISLYYLELYFLRRLFFRAMWRSRQHWMEGTEIFHILSAPRQAQPPPLSTSPARVGHLSLSATLHRHVIITQSP